jgi:hypothetical protein
MAREASLDEQLELLHKVIGRTRTGKLLWERTVDPEVFKATSDSATAVLDRGGTRGLVRLRFSDRGSAEYRDVVQQSLGENDLDDEIDRDALLDHLYHRVYDRLAPPASPARRFSQEI